MANPYIAFALLIHAGLHGIENRLNLPEPADINLYTAPPERCGQLPPPAASLTEAAAAAAKSEFIAEHLPEVVARAYFRH